MQKTAIFCDICGKELVPVQGQPKADEFPYIEIKQSQVGLDKEIIVGSITNLPEHICRGCFEKAFGLELKRQLL